MNESVVIEPDEDRAASVRRKAQMVKWGLGLGAAMLLAPLIWFLAYTMLGLAALGAATALAAVVGLAVINAAPVVAMKFENRKINAIKAEAAANPITTMQALYTEGERELQQHRTAIGEFATEVSVFEQRKNAHKKEFPDDSDAIAGMEADLEQYKQLLTLRETKYREAVAQHKTTERTIRLMKSRYEAATAGVKANKLASGQIKDVYAKIKADASADAVERKQAEAFGALRAALLDAPAAPAKPAPVEVQVIENKPAEPFSELQPTNGRLALFGARRNRP